MITRIAALLALLERFPLFIIQFMLRLSVGVVFWKSGQVKAASWSSTVALFRDEYHVPLLPPEIAARLAETVELTCPILLWLGIASRLATLPMLGMTAVIQLLVYPNAWPQHLFWASALLLILTKGPGAISVDYWLARVFLKTG